MAQVKIRGASTPSEELTAPQNVTQVVKDKKGRSITLKKPGLVAQYRLVRAVGGEAAENRVYMNMLLPITFVIAIDGEPVPPPTNQGQIDLIVERLEEHGLNAVVAGITEHWGAIAGPSVEDAKP